jgi:DNA-binding MarR family transcriptional regulator
MDDPEKAGLVHCQPDPADRRARLIVATEQGKETLCDLERRLAEAERDVLGGLDGGERLMLRMMLQLAACTRRRERGGGTSATQRL